MKFIILFLLFLILFVEAIENSEGEIEARGKGKFVLLIHFFYLVAAKIFVLKIVYGIILYILVSKAWQFGLWFIHYLKEKKHDHYDYIEHEPYHGYDEHSYDHYGPSHQPYLYDKYGYSGKGVYNKLGSEGSSKNKDPVGSYSNYYRNYATSSSGKKHKGVYDADGSYSVKS